MDKEKEYELEDVITNDEFEIDFNTLNVVENTVENTNQFITVEEAEPNINLDLNFKLDPKIELDLKLETESVVESKKEPELKSESEPKPASKPNPKITYILVEEEEEEDNTIFIEDKDVTKTATYQTPGIKAKRLQVKNVAKG